MRVILILIFMLTGFVNAAETNDLSNGQVKKNDSQKLVSWDENSKRWISLDQFWKNYVKENQSHHWGTSRDYPQYSLVSEFDTFLVQVKSGTCLMEFYHSRWRRANDVRRWDDEFNNYSGCAKVFE